MDQFIGRLVPTVSSWIAHANAWQIGGKLLVAYVDVHAGKTLRGQLAQQKGVPGNSGTIGLKTYSNPSQKHSLRFASTPGLKQEQDAGPGRVMEGLAGLVARGAGFSE